MCHGFPSHPLEYRTHAYCLRRCLQNRIKLKMKWNTINSIRSWTKHVSSSQKLILCRNWQAFAITYDSRVDDEHLVASLNNANDPKTTSTLRRTTMLITPIRCSLPLSHALLHCFIIELSWSFIMPGHIWYENAKSKITAGVATTLDNCKCRHHHARTKFDILWEGLH